jgi:hypothetical protein
MSGITSHRDPLISDSDGMELGVNVQTWLKYKQRRGKVRAEKGINTGDTPELSSVRRELQHLH